MNILALILIFLFNIAHAGDSESMETSTFAIMKFRPTRMEEMQRYREKSAKLAPLPELNNGEIEVLKSYTTSGFIDINSFLRADDFQKDSYYIKNKNLATLLPQYDQIFQKAPTLKSGTILFRGVTVADVIHPGDIFVDNGFVSTTTDPIIARKYAQNKFYDMIRIPPDSQVKALGIEALSHWGGEAEVLLDRGIKFKVQKVYKLEGGKTVRVLEALGPDSQKQNAVQLFEPYFKHREEIDKTNFAALNSPTEHDLDPLIRAINFETNNERRAAAIQTLNRWESLPDKTQAALVKISSENLIGGISTNLLTLLQKQTVYGPSMLDEIYNSLSSTKPNYMLFQSKAAKLLSSQKALPVDFQKKVALLVKNENLPISNRFAALDIFTMQKQVAPEVIASINQIADDTRFKDRIKMIQTLDSSSNCLDLVFKKLVN